MSRALVESLRIGPEKNFCYAILCPETLEMALVDPSFEFDRVFKWAQSLTQHPTRLQIKYLIATHWHWDHAGGFPEMLKRVPEAKVIAGSSEEGKFKEKNIPFDRGVQDGETFELGRLTFRAIHTPGHTTGGTCYIVDDQIFTGDTLFVGQCGRTDLEGGSDEQLFKSLQKLKSLPPEIVVRPGHDYGRTPTSTIDVEVKTNQAMMAKTLAEFKALP